MAPKRYVAADKVAAAAAAEIVQGLLIIHLSRILNYNNSRGVVS